MIIGSTNCSQAFTYVPVFLDLDVYLFLILVEQVRGRENAHVVRSITRYTSFVSGCAGQNLVSGPIFDVI